MAEKIENINNYALLIEIMDSTSIVPNLEKFDCSLCFEIIEPYKGVVLRECLHMFCKYCLKQLITLCEEASVKCPYADTTYSCDSHILESEIRSLVSPEIYEKYLSRTFVLAERQAKNAFHCKTINCSGWCINEGQVQTFHCPVCKNENCIRCEVIHTGMSCNQFNLLKCEDIATANTLSSKLNSGVAMRCPQCKIIIEKSHGCDGMLCTNCRTYICWATKGARWGPGGIGDTSGGCRCGVNGAKCHPCCSNCH